MKLRTRREKASFVAKILVGLLVLGLLYLLTLFFPQIFFRNQFTVGNITIYSDEEIPQAEAQKLLESVQAKISKSPLYKPETQHQIFIANNSLLWSYVSNFSYNAGAVNYVAFNHNVFMRRVDIKDNRLYGPSGNKISGSRTLDYFMAHELTHTLEFQSMPWWQYPFNSNWVIEGYSEYVGHDSESYAEALDHYLHVPENSGAKNYTRMRVLVAYLLEEKKLSFNDLWQAAGDYDNIKREAIRDDKPAIDENVYKW